MSLVFFPPAARFHRFQDEDSCKADRKCCASGFSQVSQLNSIVARFRFFNNPLENLYNTIQKNSEAAKCVVMLTTLNLSSSNIFSNRSPTDRLKSQPISLIQTLTTHTQSNHGMSTCTAGFSASPSTQTRAAVSHSTVTQ